MEYGILVGVIAVLGISALYGYKKGFVKIVLSMVATIVTFILAAVLTVPVSAMLKTTTSVYDYIEKSVENVVMEADVDINTIEKLELPKQIENAISKGAKESVGNLSEYLVKTISEIILKAITFCVLIVVIYIIVRIVIIMCDAVSKLPVINGINKTGGLVVGLFQGLLIVWLGCLVLTACGDKAWARAIFVQINDNSLLSFIYNNNPIIHIITNFIK